MDEPRSATPYLKVFMSHVCSHSKYWSACALIIDHNSKIIRDNAPHNERQTDKLVHALDVCAAVRRRMFTSCFPVRRCSLPVPYWLMCSAWVLDRRSIAARMAFMPPSLRMDSVEKLVCAPVPADSPYSLSTYVKPQSSISWQLPRQKKKKLQIASSIFGHLSMITAPKS